MNRCVNKFSEKDYCKLFQPSVCTYAERMINIKTLLKVPQKATALIFM